MGEHLDAPGLRRVWRADGLTVREYADRARLGTAAARAVAERMRALLDDRPEISMVFAAASSQNEFLAELCAQDLPWQRVVAFHLDEYVGLDRQAPQGFGNFLRQRLFDVVRPGQVHYLDGNAPDLAAECRRYAALLAEHPLDVACIGIGENGHVAFNDPPVADFADPLAVKAVELEERCRWQQVHDGCFATVDEVPTHALTLTVPTILRAEWLYCVVPAASKAQAVAATVRGPISTACPASALRHHPRATLFVDPDSARLVR